MSPDWQEFLIAQGAQINVDRVSEFTERNKKASGNKNFDNIITDLSHLALIEISGEDANDFLNGQFTTNIKQLARNHLQFSAWCNPKGQVKTTFFIYLHDAGFNILLPAELKESFLKQLQMYILRANVKLIDKSDELVRIGIQINNNILDEMTGSVPAQEGDITIQDDLHCIRVFGPENNLQRYIIIGLVERLKTLWNDFTNICCPVNAALWELLDIQAAYPWLSSQTSENFLPQMLNLDLIDGLDYQKGCYPGQEIIARLHYRGQLKRSLYLATSPLDSNPESGDRLYIDNFEQSVGTVINAQSSLDKLFLLAVIDNNSIDKPILLRGSDGPKLDLLSLPYSKK